MKTVEPLHSIKINRLAGSSFIQQVKFASSIDDSESLNRPLGFNIHIFSLQMSGITLWDVKGNEGISTVFFNTRHNTVWGYVYST